MFKTQRVRLLTKIGEGTPIVVGTFEMPEFRFAPDVVTWGERTFNRTDTISVDAAGIGTAEYVESISFNIPIEIESLEAAARRAAGKRTS